MFLKEVYSMKKSPLILLVISLVVLASVPAWSFELPDSFTMQVSGFEFLNLQVLPPGGPFGDGIEDNWGIGNITAIYGSDPTPVWQEGDDGEHLRIIYWGLDTTSSSFPSFTTGQAAIDITGSMTIPYAGADIWLWDSDLPGYTDIDPSGGPGARLDFDLYPTVSGGNIAGGMPLARLVFGPGVVGPTDITLGFYTGELTGLGAGYLDVIPGSGAIADLTDTNGFPTAYGDRDIFFQFNYSIPGPYGWQLTMTDPLFGNTSVAVPEPSTIFLLGAGLAGVGLMRRRFTN
jgi:hypothetical protein